ncbi:F0F1 ATP synthase subunit gamma [bacterium]|nr:F0F1 ATP synthase subunit gamma [bacterium]
MAKEFLSLKKQISIIQDIRETVKALEKISAANLHNLKIISQRMKDYERSLKKIFVELEEIPFSSPWCVRSSSLPDLIVVLGPQTGLCGEFLHNLFDFLKNIVKENNKVLIIGKKGLSIAQERGIRVDYFFPATKEIPSEVDIKKIKDFILNQFLKRKVGKVVIIWPAFRSLALQEPTITIFLPIDSKELRKEIGEREKSILLGDPIFEPSSKEIMNYLMEEYLSMVLYQKILETKLSELSARTVFMENAGEKAQNLIQNLFLRYSKARRKTITKEITELYVHHKLKKLCPIPER